MHKVYWFRECDIVRNINIAQYVSPQVPKEGRWVLMKAKPIDMKDKNKQVRLVFVRHLQDFKEFNCHSVKDPRISQVGTFDPSVIVRGAA